MKAKKNLFPALLLILLATPLLAMEPASRGNERGSHSAAQRRGESIQIRSGIEDGEISSFSAHQTQPEVSERTNYDDSDGDNTFFEDHQPDPELIASIIRQNKTIDALKGGMSSLKQDYADQKALIVDAAKQKILQLKSSAQMAPKRSAFLPLALIVRPDHAESAIQKINAQSALAIRFLELEYAKSYSNIRALHYFRLLEKRLMRHRTSVEQEVQRDLLLPEDRVIRALKLKQHAFDLLGNNLTQFSEEDLSIIGQIISYADAIAVVAFSDGAKQEIGEAQLQLDKLPESLRSIADRDLDGKNKFSSCQRIQEIQRICHQNHADFLLAQTVSEHSAGVVAATNAAILFKKAQELKTNAERAITQIRFAGQEDQINLCKQAKTFNELASALEQTAFAYDTIADACTVDVELRSIPQVKEDLAQARTTFSHHRAIASAPSLIQEMLDELSRLLNETDLTPLKKGAIFDLDILSHLQDITDRDNEAVMALNGKIVLAQLPSPFPSDLNRQPYIYGIHLIRLALFREFGRHGLQRFDECFQSNILAETPITLGAIREFIATEATAYNNPRSYFITENHSIEELLKIQKDSPENHKIMKADGTSTVSFNPFLTTSTADDQLSDETNSIPRGIEVAKMTLKSFLEKEPALDPVQIETILRNFDATFNADDSNKQLTVNKLKIFTKSELKRALSGMSLAEWFSAAPRNSGLNSLAWRIVTAGTASVLMSQPHLSPWLKGAILVSEASISDQTALWRARSAPLARVEN